MIDMNTQHIYPRINLNKSQSVLFYYLFNQVANHKQEEDTLLTEMEVTGQAFEDMQEQNDRLIQQLRYSKIFLAKYLYLYYGSSH